MTPDTRNILAVAAFLLEHGDEEARDDLLLATFRALVGWRTRRRATAERPQPLPLGPLFTDNESCAPRCVRCGEGAYVSRGGRIVCSFCGAG